MTYLAWGHNGEVIVNKNAEYTYDGKDLVGGVFRCGCDPFLQWAE